MLRAMYFYVYDCFVLRPALVVKLFTVEKGRPTVQNQRDCDRHCSSRACKGEMIMLEIRFFSLLSALSVTLWRHGDGGQLIAE